MDNDSSPETGSRPRKASRGIRPVTALALFGFAAFAAAGYAVAKPRLAARPPDRRRAPSHPIPAGTFIQEYLVKDWDDAHWLAEYRAMKQVGMGYIVFGSTADSAQRITYFPTNVPGFRQAEGYDDPVDACLRNAKKAGIKVFLGLNFHKDWWSKAATDPEWLFGQMRDGNALADDLYRRYHARYPGTFAGWYWVWEVDNLNYNASKERATLAEALDINVRHLKRLNSKMPVMLCPFMNYRLGEPAAYRDLWTYVFAHTSLGKGDIFCPQDCVGAGGLTLDRVDAWFSALRKAVDTKPGLRFWSDTETFDQSDWTAAPLDRFVAQMRAVQPYVEKSLTFAYSHYYSPNNAAPGFQRTLADYVRTGRLESTPPTAPSGLRAVRDADGGIRVSWSPARDNIGVCGYSVFRDGAFIGRLQAPLGASAAHVPPTSLVDKDVPPGIAHSYEVEAYDFAGNASMRIGPAVVAPDHQVIKTTGSSTETIPDR